MYMIEKNKIINLKFNKKNQQNICRVESANLTAAQLTKPFDIKYFRVIKIKCLLYAMIILKNKKD
jgi:hypothetical protein